MKTETSSTLPKKNQNLPNKQSLNTSEIKNVYSEENFAVFNQQTKNQTSKQNNQQSVLLQTWAHRSPPVLRIMDGFWQVTQGI